MAKIVHRQIPAPRELPQKIPQAKTRMQKSQVGANCWGKLLMQIPGGMVMTEIDSCIIRKTMMRNRVNPIKAGVFVIIQSWGGTLCPPPFNSPLLSNYHQTWHDSAMAQDFSNAVKFESIMTSL